MPSSRDSRSHGRHTATKPPKGNSNLVNLEWPRNGPLLDCLGKCKAGPLYYDVSVKLLMVVERTERRLFDILEMVITQLITMCPVFADFASLKSVLRNCDATLTLHARSLEDILHDVQEEVYDYIGEVYLDILIIEKCCRSLTLTPDAPAVHRQGALLVNGLINTTVEKYREFGGINIFGSYADMVDVINEYFASPQHRNPPEIKLLHPVTPDFLWHLNDVFIRLDHCAVERVNRLVAELLEIQETTVESIVSVGQPAPRPDVLIRFLRMGSFELLVQVIEAESGERL